MLRPAECSYYSNKSGRIRINGKMEQSNRKQPRLPGFDYSRPMYYFVTVCTAEKRKIFGEPLNLNKYGKIAETAIQKIHEHYPSTYVDKYVVMPNHIHMILVLEQMPEKTCSLTTVIGSLKSAVSKEIHLHCPDKEIWQRSFYDHIIRNQKDYEAIWMYIEDNPRKWIENGHD